MTAESLPARAPNADRPPRSAFARRTALAGLAVLVAGFVALGTWQVERRAWKLGLIERVEQRVRAEPVAAPEAAPAPDRIRADWEYRRVSATGRYLAGADAFVQAVTDLGAGFWVLTPLRRAGGDVVLVNRGFVAARSAAAVPAGVQTVTGLLRLTEPGGGFLRRNDPAADRWFSRDVAALAAARRWSPAAPYFIDAETAGTESAAADPDEPVGGLTVVRFSNNHLVYAVTWYTLAVLSVAAAVPLVRESRRLRGRAPPRASRPMSTDRLGMHPTDIAGAASVRPIGASPSASDPVAAGLRNMQQLIQLRWIAVVGQIATITVVHLGFAFSLPLDAMLTVLACLAGFNVLSLLRWRRHREVSNGELFFALLVDVAALTAQLYLSGGATNPFIFLYLLQVILAAVLLEPWSTWTMVGVTSACFAGVTLLSAPLGLPFDQSQGLGSAYVQGMLICFALNAGLVAVFIKRINRNLRARDARLADLRQRAAEEEHIVRMGLLASGAAHELGTPLATLSVILGDWRRMPAFKTSPELLQEIGEMQTQLQRCKSIVSGILLSAGEARGEAIARTTIGDFLDGLVREWRGTRTCASFAFDNRFADDDLPMVSDSALKQMVCNVLDNALEASPDWVRLDAAREGDALCLEVRDAGPGFAPEMLAHFGKPYRSTKGRPGGGLGLFLVVNVARTLGGSVAAHNLPEGGACVRLRLPLAAITLDKDRGSPPVDADRTLLIVEDDAAFARTLARSFERRGYAVVQANSLPAVESVLAAHSPGYAVVDLKLAGDASGLACVKRLHAHDPAMLIVVLTGFASIATAVEAIKLGACHYLAKPSNTDDIEAAFDRADGDTAVTLTQRSTSIKTLEWERIHETLADTGFNISETARRLGMHRRTLARKLEKQRVK